MSAKSKTTEERPDYWDGYHQAMLGHPLQDDGGAEYRRGHAEGLATFARMLNEPEQK